MITRRLTGVLAATLLLGSSGAWAQAALDAARIASAGNGRGAPPCATCHGANGGGQAAAGYPRLAGLDAAYLNRQVQSFVNGSRSNPVMVAIAKALSDEERQALSAYYAAMPVPAPAGKDSASPSDNPVGQSLAQRGRWSRQVPGCVACHGPHGVGVGAHFPPLAGQPAAYLASQLTAWQKGTRRNDPLDLMQHVAAALSAADIEAVSAWFAAQPATLPGGDTP
ncbi:MAG TPA: c-type cytochrome [Rhodanobacteraceae bacterium]|nr:c-type cytochrome [Rhodanobacteraceae bacterium]